jgi:dTDP-4-dehydrorhamnose 3,5-epimerase
MAISVEPTVLPGVLLVRPDVFGDDRGFFSESYHRARYAEHGIPEEFVQDNHSRSAGGVLRGIHYQDARAPMAKLVRCTRGAILDVAVDLRVGAPTFGKWVSAELSEENFLQFYVPAGFGHAFLALSAVAEVQYRCSAYYAPETEGAIAWDDPELAIAWPRRDPVLSKRDAAAMSLREYTKLPFRFTARD